MLWDDEPAEGAALPPNRALHLIGYPPSLRLSLEVEAMVEDGVFEDIPTSIPLSSQERDAE